MKYIKHKNPLTGIIFSAATLLVLVGIMSAGDVYRKIHDNGFLKTLHEKVEAYNSTLPEDRVYVQFDKPFYSPGETIWFSTYIRYGADLAPSVKSDIVHVELINPKGAVEKHLKLVAANGQAAGDFQLDPQVPGGLYKVKAYTNWQQNEKQQTFFEKEIQVQQYVLPALKMKLDFERKAFGAGDNVLAKINLHTNENKPLTNYTFRYIAKLEGDKLVEEEATTNEDGEGYFSFKLPKNLKTNDGLLNVLISYEGSTESISRSIPIILNKIDFAMYPEGGDLVEGLPTQVAFRARNEFGKPADVEGVVENEDGDVVAEFTSFHMGMGAFSFKPNPNEKYVAKITKPEGIKENFPLPEALPSGQVLQVSVPKENKMILNVHTTKAEELSLVAQVRGQVYFSGAIYAAKGGNKIEVPTKDFPTGTAQVTLFDSKGVARAERLVFLHKDRQLNIEVKTDKQQYLPREKVNMTIKVTDENGNPVPANLSLAVVDDQLLSFADNRSGNIVSQLLLEQDIQEKIEEPAFYFDPKEEKADQALDYLLMTSGWRRFAWKEVLDDALPNIAYASEQAVIGGVVYDGSTRKPLQGAKVTLGAQTVETGKDGRYMLRNTEPVFPMMVKITAKKFRNTQQYAYDYTQDLQTYLYDEDYYVKRYKYKSAQRNMAPMEGAGGQFDMNPVAPMPMVEKAEVEEEQVFAAEVKKAEKGKAGKKQDRVAMAADTIDMGLNALNGLVFFDKEIAPPVAQYYRAREFAAPVYDKEEQVEMRTDFRSTIYWDGGVVVGASGQETISFYNADNVTSYRITIEGISNAGLIGRSETTYFTQLPFALRTKIPVEVVTDDVLSIPVTLKNNTKDPLGGVMNITAPEGFKSLTTIAEGQTIMPGKAKTLYMKYKVLHTAKTGTLSISFKSCGLSDAFTKQIKVVPQGFPAQASFSGQDLDAEYTVNLAHVVDGSLSATLTAYPSVVNDLLSGIEGILREPSGCFEQTSMSSYPNAMVLDYLITTDTKNDKVFARATNLLDKGYNRLTTFETKEKGYEWFGSAPGHEALSAYGLMQFADMERVGGKVDQKMMDRTATWLMSRRDGNGGFKQNARALDNFGRGGQEITDTYITYALAEAGYKDIQKELDLAYSRAAQSKDPYMLGLAANAMYASGDEKRGDKLMDLLAAQQADNGSWTGKTHSITHSTGQSLTIETTSLVIMAMLKQEGHNIKSLTQAVQFLVSSRSGNGTFGNTQGTVLALKALTAYAKASRKTSSGGTLEFYVGRKKVAERAYKAGDKGNIEITGLEQYLSSGKNKLKVKFKGTKEALPYTVSVNWNTTLPNSAEACVLDLKTTLSEEEVTVGATNRLSVTITNKKAAAIPTPIAIIGIPAGYTAQPWQLKELQEKGVVDFYELEGNNIVIYFRAMKAEEVKNINFDLKAEVPGEYQAPASSAYLYYTNEYKSWTALGKAVIVVN